MEPPHFLLEFHYFLYEMLPSNKREMDLANEANTIFLKKLNMYIYI